MQKLLPARTCPDRMRLLKQISFLMKAGTLFISFLLCSAQVLLAIDGNGQEMNEKKITLGLDDEPLLEALNKVEKLSGIRLAYVVEQVSPYDHISLPKATRTVGQTLHLLLSGTRLGCRQDGNTVLIFPNPIVLAEASRAAAAGPPAGLAPPVDTTRTIKGRVQSENGDKSIEGASVSVKGYPGGATTDAEGRFTLTTGKSAAVLQVSYVGMQPFETPIGTESFFVVRLKAADRNMGEVVVTALGISRQKRALAYSVQELDGAAINKTRDANVVNALSGKISGIQVTSSSGSVGASSRIVIRGANSFGENQPLFVVDGIPISNASSAVNPNGATDYGNAISDINPDDIKSVSVLKGANAAALYGSRAANGVILITTKSGKSKSGFGVDLSTSSTMDKVYILPDYQNSYGLGYYGSEHEWKLNQPQMTYQDYSKQYGYNYVDGRGGGVNDMSQESWGPRLDAGLKLDQFTGPDQAWVSHPNNVKDFFQTGFITDNNIALHASGDKASGRLSLSNMTQQGITPNTDLKQNTFNFSGEIHPIDRLTAQVNVSYIDKWSNNLGAGQYSYNNPQFIFAWFGRQVDMAPLKANWQKNDANGLPYSWEHYWWDNPYLAMHNTSSFDRHRLFGNLDVTYKLNDWVSVRARAGTDFYNESRLNITQSRSILSTSGGAFSQTSIFRSETNVDGMLLLNHRLGHDFSIDGIFGANYQHANYRDMSLAASQLTIPDLYTIGNVKGQASTSMYRSEKEMHSVYGSFNLSYKDYLYLGVTGRNDWSSALPADNRSYFYPSVSAGWIFSDALGLRSNTFSFGKLRASWAQVGKDTDPYQTRAVYTAGSSPWNGTAFFTSPYTIPSINLKPEKTLSMEIGTELRFLRDRLGLNMTYYDTKTRNQIMSVNISSPSGYNSMLINAGEIENRGVELMLNGKILQSSPGLNWDMTINWGRNRNRVNKLYGDLQSYNLGPNVNVQVQAVPGKPWGEMYGGGYLRDASGNIIVDSKGLPQPAANLRLGNVTPSWTGGISNEFSYRRLFASFLVDFRWGGDMFSYTAWHDRITGVLQETVDGNVREKGLIVPGVTQDGKPNTQTVTAYDYFHGDYNWSIVEPAVFKASYIKLRELVIGYSFPIRNPKALKSANLSLVGRNLALLYTDKSNTSHIDPETGVGNTNSGVGIEVFQIPPARSLGIKLQVSF
ncbi:MAG: SusC/RagA family TonB-linked outer membrane protein [Bacteroidetes bacterium]|nr:SusC/RagA family TonB-linked outer membrane protein [Bacteroidota bacterium]